MVYAQIKNGIIQNIIVLQDASLIPLFSIGYDSVIQIDNLQMVPQMGWLYDGKIFSAPPPAPIDYQAMVQKAIDGFNQIMLKYVASNITQGITQAGKTQLIADALQTVQRYGQSGSLYAAITALQEVQLTPQMDPFLNQAVINNLISQAQGVLANL